jgi:pyruvate ferredoxin oxidoreductase beta subunit
MMTEKSDFKGFKARELPQVEPFAAGHRSCVGCGEVLALRLATKAIGLNLIVASATGCMEIVSSPYPQSAWEVPWIHVAFENAAAVASGIESGLKALRRKGKLPDRKTVIMAVAGDGGTADIGLQALSGALERGHDFVYICTDNEAYMNTGIQRSSSTPFGAATTTSPAGKRSIGQVTWKKDLPAIAAAHHIPYVATACPTYYLDLMNKVKRAAETPGPAYVHIYSPCPTGWRYPGELSIEVGRLAVQTGVFPLYEVINGNWKLTMDFAKRKPVSEYLKMQGRFKHLTKETIEEIQRRVDENLLRLKMLQKYSAHLENAKYYALEAQV